MIASAAFLRVSFSSENRGMCLFTGSVIRDSSYTPTAALQAQKRYDMCQDVASAYVALSVLLALAVLAGADHTAR